MGRKKPSLEVVFIRSSFLDGNSKWDVCRFTTRPDRVGSVETIAREMTKEAALLFVQALDDEKFLSQPGGCICRGDTCD